MTQKKTLRLLSIIIMSALLFAAVACKDNTQNNGSSESGIGFSNNIESENISENSGVTESDESTISAGSSQTSGNASSRGSSTKPVSKPGGNSNSSSKPSPEKGTVTGDTSYSISRTGLSSKTIYKIDAAVFQNSNIMEHDIMRMVVCLQGLINRDFEKNQIAVYLNTDSSDPFWLSYISASGKILNGFETVNITSLDGLLNTFKNQLVSTGMIAWDQNVPATANVASTICGLDGYIPVKYDNESTSLYNKLKALGVPLKMTLVGKFTGKGTIVDTNLKSSGSTKCDAYLWAMEKYMKRCSTKYIAYTPDGAGSIPTSATGQLSDAKTAGMNGIPNHDYLIARRCFFFDLTCTDTEKPCDDKNQPLGTDRQTLIKIFMKRYELSDGSIGQLLGFPPWWIKYTNYHNQGSLEPTTLEWNFVEFATAYNLVKEADAAQPCSMTNASIYYKYKLKSSYTNTAPTKKMTFDKNKRYFTIYIGDYDSSAWMKYHIPTFFKDSQRGKIPLMWSFNPNLSERVPMVFDYVYQNKTANDYFAAGEGAGYPIPAAFVKGTLRELPTALSKWVSYSKPYFNKFDMDITGFIINGYNPLTEEVMAAYNKISPAGSFHNDYNHMLTIYKGVPYIHLQNGVSGKGVISDATKEMYRYATKEMKAYNFSAYRTVCDSPSDIRRLTSSFIAYAKTKNPNVEFVYVDPYTFFDLIKQSGQGTIIN